MNDFTPIPALVGGALIGLSASLLFLSHGKTAGISGMLGGLVAGITQRTLDGVHRLWFVVGLLVSGLAFAVFRPQVFGSANGPAGASIPTLVVAGLLVGFGTRLGSGCTSGHGVCGLSRFSLRSLVATLTFMFVAAATVFVVRRSS